MLFFYSVVTKNVLARLTRIYQSKLKSHTGCYTDLVEVASLSSIQFQKINHFGESILTISNLTKKFGYLTAVKDLSVLPFNKGNVYGILRT